MSANSIKDQIYEACKNANLYRLDFILKHTQNQQEKEKILKMFDLHMKQLTQYIINSDFHKTWKLSEEFIKGLHKRFFPPGYKKTKKLKNGQEIVYFIPGQYKIFPNHPRVAPKDVKKEMKKWINDYNLYWKNRDFDYYALKMLDFFRIHPFTNWNGVTISIIFDLMLLYNNLKPYWLKAKYLIPGFRLTFYNIIDNALKTKNYNNYLKFLKNFY